MSNINNLVVEIAVVRAFILRSNPHILDIDAENVIKMLQGENYSFVNKDRFYENCDE